MYKLLTRNTSGGSKKSSPQQKERRSPPPPPPQHLQQKQTSDGSKNSSSSKSKERRSRSPLPPPLQQQQQQLENEPSWIRNRTWDLKYVEPPAWPTEAEEYLVLDTQKEAEAFRNWILQQGGNGGGGGMPDNKYFACRGRDTVVDDWDYGAVVKVNQILFFRYQSGDQEIFPINSLNFVELVQFAMGKRIPLPPSPLAQKTTPSNLHPMSQHQQQKKKKKNHVFLSYCRKDLKFASYLRAILEQEYGIEVWMDKENLTPGMNWSSELENALDSSGAVVIVMTPDANQSTFVEIEILHAIDQNKPIFPILLIGSSPLFLLKSKQYEDMRGGLSARPSPEFIQNLRSVLDPAGIDQSSKKKNIQLEIIQSDVRKVECDVLALKYARSFYGADRIVCDAFNRFANEMADATFSIDTGPLANGKHILRETNACIVAKNVLYIPTVRLIKFDYDTIRQIAMDAIEIVSENEDLRRGKNKFHIAMTIHGVGFGLDEANCIKHQLQGLLDGLTSSSGKALDMIERITIIDWEATVVKRLNSVAGQFFKEIGLQWDGSFLSLPGDPKDNIDRRPSSIIINKSYGLFVTSEISTPGEDTFCYGIQHPVHAMGLLCERMKTSDAPLKGDMSLLQRKLQRIQRSKVVIFDADCFASASSKTMTGSSPGGGNDVCDVDGVASSATTTGSDTANNSKEIFCLLLGCAWGAGIPTRLITNQENDSNSLEFDLDHYLQYENIKDLENQVSEWLKDALD